MTSATRVISFTSGKGGTGKTTVVVNLSCALANLGRRVLVLDADLGLANVDIMFGIRPQGTIEEVAKGEKRIEDIVCKTTVGVDVIPAASAIAQIPVLDNLHRVHLLEELERLATGYDYLLIDTQAGIGPEVMFFNCASSEIVCVVTPEPTSLTDVYALIKLMMQRHGEKKFSVVVNNVVVDGRQGAQGRVVGSSWREGVELCGRRAFNKLAAVVERFLQASLRFRGAIPAEGAVRDAIVARDPLFKSFPSCQGSAAFAALAERFEEDFFEQRIKGGMQLFFRRLLDESNSAEPYSN